MAWQLLIMRRISSNRQLAEDMCLEKKGAVIEAEYEHWVGKRVSPWDFGSRHRRDVAMYNMEYAVLRGRFLLKLKEQKKCEAGPARENKTQRQLTSRLGLVGLAWPVASDLLPASARPPTRVRCESQAGRLYVAGSLWGEQSACSTASVVPFVRPFVRSFVHRPCRFVVICIIVIVTIIIGPNLCFRSHTTLTRVATKSSTRRSMWGHGRGSPCFFFSSLYGFSSESTVSRSDWPSWWASRF
jgi:hypothetical protein